MLLAILDFTRIPLELPSPMDVPPAMRVRLQSPPLTRAIHAYQGLTLHPRALRLALTAMQASPLAPVHHHALPASLESTAQPEARVSSASRAFSLELIPRFARFVPRENSPDHWDRQAAVLVLLVR